MTTTERVDIDLLTMAAELVITSQHASAPMLQRKLRTSWVDTEAILAELEAWEIVASDQASGWLVTVTPDDLDDVLEEIASAGGQDAEDLDGQAGGQLVDTSGQAAGGAHQDSSVVSLVKHQPHLDDPAGAAAEEPGTALAVPADTDLEPYQQPTRTRWHVQGLVTRPLRSTALTIAHQPAAARTLARVRQSRKVAKTLVCRSPHGVAHLARLVRGWLVDIETLELMAAAHHSQDIPAYEKATKSREAKNLAGRRRTAATIALATIGIGLAWWAPAAFAGILAALVFAVVLALAPRRGSDELIVATLAATATWFAGPWLAARIPQPPTWFWWGLLVIGVPVFGWLGRKRDQPLVDLPPEFTKPDEPDKPTADMIVEALCRIGLPGMTMEKLDAVRAEIRVIAPGVATSSHGYTIELELPPGRTAEEVVGKRAALAGALRRDLGCVWPSGNEDRHPGHLRLFLSHKPMNKAKQPPWPLAAGKPVDIFEPMPLFTDEEMRWVCLTLAGTPHLAVGGASGFGKSVWLRQLSCGVAFDLRVRIVVIDGKRSGDLDHVRKLAHAFHEGADPEDVEAVAAELRGLVAEYLKRSKFLSSLPAEERSPKVTSVLASKYPDQLSPIVVFYDEVQEGTQYGVKTSRADKAIRDEITGQLTRLSRVGRSAGIYLVLASQRPEADVIPSSIMGNCSIRVAFKVSDQTHNDQILGTSARRNGIDATMFGTRDKGMAWLKGGDDVDAQVVRSWSEMVDVSVAVDLADKAYEMRKAAGLLTGQAAGEAGEEIRLNLLADVDQVMRENGRPTAHLSTLAGWLQERRPDYVSLDVDELGARLRNLGVETPQVKVGGRTTTGVRGVDLRRRLAEQASNLTNLDEE